jgi:hypothetical protein
VPSASWPAKWQLLAGKVGSDRSVCTPEKEKFLERRASGRETWRRGWEVA